MRTTHKLAAMRVVHRVVAALRGAAGRPPNVRVRRRGLWWELDLAEAIDLSIYLLGGFELGVSGWLRRLTRPGDVVVDVGANIGAHTLPLARCVGPTGRVVAYEPTAFAFRKMTRNIALNPDLAPRVAAFQAMLVAREGEGAPAALYSSWPLRDRHDLHHQHEGRLMDTGGAQARTLDGHLAELGLGKVALVKVDVDGWECDVLRGAAATLERDRPLVVMEWAPYIHQEMGHRLGDCVSVLTSLGYAFRNAAGGRPLPPLERAAAKIAPGESINVIGRPGRADGRAA